MGAGIVTYVYDPGSPIAAVATHPEGDVLVSFAIKDTSGKLLTTTGGMYMDTAGNYAIVAFAPDGLPARYDLNGTLVDVIRYGSEVVDVRWLSGFGWQNASLAAEPIRPFLERIKIAAATGRDDADAAKLRKESGRRKSRDNDLVLRGLGAVALTVSVPGFVHLRRRHNR